MNNLNKDPDCDFIDIQMKNLSGENQSLVFKADYEELRLKTIIKELNSLNYVARVVKIQGEAAIHVSTKEVCLDNTANFPSSESEVLNEDVCEEIEDEYIGSKKLRLNQQIFCFTGYRDEEAEMHIISNGGIISSSFTNSVTCLVAKNPNGNSSKINKAKTRGIKIISPYEFSLQTDFNKTKAA